MEWSQDSCSHLVQLFRERKFLWDSLNTNYKNKYRRNNAWCEIALILYTEKKNGEENKMKRLIGQFQRERKTNKSGHGKDDIIE